MSARKFSEHGAATAGAALRVSPLREWEDRIDEPELASPALSSRAWWALPPGRGEAELTHQAEASASLCQGVTLWWRCGVWSLAPLLFSMPYQYPSRVLAR